MNSQEKALLENLDSEYAWPITHNLVELSDHKVAGTDRDHEAAFFIKEEMEKIELSKVTMESFPVVSRDIAGGGQLIIDGSRVINVMPMINSWGTSADGITGELLYVGEGTVDNYSEELDLSNKIVIYKRRWPDMTGEDGIFRSTPALEAWSRRAKAIICFDDLGPKDAVRIQIFLLGKDNYRLKIPILAISQEDANKLIQMINKGPVKATLHSSIKDPTPGESFNVLGYINGSKYPDSKWTESIAVGDKEFVLETKAKQGAKAMGRRALENNDGYELRETQNSYNSVFAPEKCSVRLENAHYWKIS